MSKRSFKRILTVGVMVVVMGSTSFLSSAIAQKKMEVHFFHYWPAGVELEAINRVCDLFEKEYPDIKVVRYTTAHEAAKALLRIVVAGAKPPDVITMHQGERTGVLVRADLISPITQIWEKNNWDKVFGLALRETGSYDDEVYSMGMVKHFTAFWYNKDVFDKMGLHSPETWKEYLALCEKIKNAGIVPITIGLKDRWPAQFWHDYILFRTTTLKFYDGLMAGRDSYNDVREHRLFEIWRELVDKEYFLPDPVAYDWKECIGPLLRGEAAMYLMGDWAAASMVGDFGWEPKVDFDWFAFPTISPGLPEVCVGPVDGILLPKRGRNPKVAEIFLQFLATEEAQRTFVRLKGGLMTNELADATGVYNPIQKEVAAYVRGKPWRFQHDLATTHKMADHGLDLMAAFMENPDKINELLIETDRRRKEIFFAK